MADYNGQIIPPLPELIGAAFQTPRQFVQRVWSSGLGVWCYFTQATINASPLSTETTPNWTGATSGHEVIGSYIGPAQGAVADTPTIIFGSSVTVLELDYTLGLSLGTSPAVAGWADQTDFGSNGAQVVVADQPNLVYNGLNFDGVSDNFVVADSSSLDATTELLIGISFIPAVVVGNQAPLTKSTTGGGSWSLQTSAAAMRMHFGAPGTNFGEGGTMVAGVQQNLIQQFEGAGVGNAARLQQYLNSLTASALAFTGTIPATIAVGTNDVKIGTWANNLQFFNGVVKRVTLVRAVSNADQRARLYNWLSRA